MKKNQVMMNQNKKTTIPKKMKTQIKKSLVMMKKIKVRKKRQNLKKTKRHQNPKVLKNLNLILKKQPKKSKNLKKQVINGTNLKMKVSQLKN